MSKCLGGFLILFLFILEILCIILYNTVGIKKTIGFIFKVSEHFKDLNQFKLNQDPAQITEAFIFRLFIEFTKLIDFCLSEKIRDSLFSPIEKSS